MKQEDKQLLLKDLCGRLPYSPFVQLLEKFDDEDSEHFREIHNLSTYDIELFNSGEISNIKPYLRPLSSMTEEEKEELSHLLPKYWSAEIDKLNNFYFDASPSIFMEIDIFLDIIDWLNAHHFDYRGLIPRGLALSTEEFNPYKD